MKLTGAIASLALAVALLGPVAPARADSAPVIDSVAVVGVAAIGAPLSAAVGVSGDPAPAVGYSWRRCPLIVVDLTVCAPIAGATAATYVPTALDAGSPLVVVVSASNSAGSATATSAPTAPVLSASGYAIPSGPRYITPFPVVRIRGSVAAHGANLRLLRVRAPRAARVTIACAGRGCPLRRLARRAGRVRVFERFLPAGVRITVRVRRRGRVGKYVRIRIRAGRPPARRDACVISLRRRPVRCPDA